MKNDGKMVGLTNQISCWVEGLLEVRDRWKLVGKDTWLGDSEGSSEGYRQQLFLGYGPGSERVEGKDGRGEECKEVADQRKDLLFMK